MCALKQFQEKRVTMVGAGGVSKCASKSHMIVNAFERDMCLNLMEEQVGS